MRKFLFAFLLLIYVLNFVSAKPLKVLWWNVENLFDTTDDPKKRDTLLSKEEFSNKILILSSMIEKIDADIVGLAEIENEYILKLLAKRSGYPYYYLEEGNDMRGIDVCLLSKFKIEYISHKDHPTPYKENKNYKFSRDCPEAVFDFEGDQIYILLNHLKSMLGDKELSLKKRVAQSKGILDIVEDIYEENNIPYIIIMGDFNSHRYTEPMNILQKSGLKILNYGYNEKNLYTYVYRKKKNDIDYIILNKEMYQIVKIKEFKSLNSRDYRKASDHYPLYLEIEIKN